MHLYSFIHFQISLARIPDNICNVTQNASFRTTLQKTITDIKRSKVLKSTVGARLAENPHQLNYTKNIAVYIFNAEKQIKILRQYSRNFAR